MPEGGLVSEGRALRMQCPAIRIGHLGLVSKGSRRGCRARQPASTASAR